MTGALPEKSGRRIEGPMPITRTRFAENVERLRREQGYSVATLAARSGIGCEELEEMLRGERRVFLDDAQLLAGALAVWPDALFEGIRWIPPSEGGPRWEVTAGGQDG